MKENELKLPPHAIEFEKAVIGTILIESKAIEEIDLQVDDFYDVKHQVIFKAILALKNSRRPIDILTVVNELNKTGELKRAGGAVYISELSDQMASSAHIRYHTAIIKQKSIARKLIIQSHNIISRSYDGSEDVQDIIEYAEKSFTEITTDKSSSDYHDLKESIKITLEYLSDLQTRKESGTEANIPTGLDGLNKQTNGGWSAPDLIVLGGRPSSGKTQFAIHFAQAAAKSGNDCLFISIEMTLVQLMMRILTEDDRISFYNMKTGQMRQDEWMFIDEKVAKIQSDKLIIADDYNIRNLNNIKTLARKLHREGRLKLLIIDYLQLIRTNLKFGTRDLEIGYITGELKNLAKELNIPVILLAQLNRGLKGVKEQLPVMSDLRESGNIEQDADKVIFPHRPTYYDETAVDKDGVSWQNRGILIIGKNREGEKDAKVYFTHDDNFKKIFDANTFAPSIDFNKPQDEPDNPF